MKHILLFVALCILVCSCEKQDERTPEIYFEHYYINYAWGTNYQHWIINDEGTVLTFRKNAVPSKNNPDMNSIAIPFDSVIYNIDKSELANYTSLIKQASEGRLDSIVMHRADFGTTGFYCYVNGGDKENSRIVLSVMSDPLDIINQDASAVKIDNWLKDINMRIINQ